MKCLSKTFFLVILFLFSSMTFSQVLDIPRTSPKASVTQMIGVNNVTVVYGRPSVRDREIIGALVPYGKVWRAGANEATTISFEEDVIFEDKQVFKGTYGLFMIPNKNAWAIILSKNANQWGAYNYDESQDCFEG